MTNRAVPAWLRRPAVKAVLTYGATNAAARGIGGMVTLVYAFRLSPEELGVFAVFMSLVGLADVLADLGISHAIIRRFFDHNDTPDGARRYLSGVIFTARLLSLAVLLAVAAGLAAGWERLVSGQIPLWPYLPFVLVLAYVGRSSKLFDGIVRTLDRPRQFASYRIVQVLTLLAGAAVFVFVLDWGVLGAVLAAVLAGVTGALFRSVSVARLVPQRVGSLPRTELKSLLAYGLPLMPRELADWGRALAVRLVLAGFLPLSQIGALFLASSIVGPIGLVITSFEMWFNPVYMQMRVRGGPEAIRKIRLVRQVLLALVTPLYVGAILFLPAIAEALLPARYALAYPLIAPLLATSYVTLLTSFQIRQLLFLKRTPTVSAISIISALVALGAAPVLAVNFGLAGVAWAGIAIAGLSLALAWAAVARSEPNELTVGMAAPAIVVVIAAALYDGLVSPGILNIGDGLVRGLLVLAVTALAAVLWVWPNRALIRSRLKD
jgi:O-antigen/teichoic acid export membrane protein